MLWIPVRFAWRLALSSRVMFATHWKANPWGLVDAIRRFLLSVLSNIAADNRLAFKRKLVGAGYDKLPISVGFCLWTFLEAGIFRGAAPCVGHPFPP